MSTLPVDSKQVNQTLIRLTRDDITRQTVDAIVNAANSSLLGGGGVDGAIHRAGGPQILEECKEIKKRQGGCPAGAAVITSAGTMAARHVVHTVGPIWHGGESGEPDILSNAYRNSLEVAAEAGDKTIAFPSISTGAYGYPTEKAAKVAVETVIEFCLANTNFAEIRFVLFDEPTFRSYQKALL